MINYSIIVPHKNIPVLLQRCIDSIPIRKDIQVIIVDDNSDPSKVDFSHFPGMGKESVEVIFNKVGKGAGFARNEGLKHAIGKWVLFADADDFFLPEFSVLLDSYCNADVDVVYFNSKSAGQNFNYTDFGEQLNKAMTTLEYDELNDYVRYIFGPPWCKMIKNDFIKKYSILFDEVPKHNDTMFSLKVGYYADQIVIDKRVVYINECRLGSISNNYNLSPIQEVQDYLNSLDVAYDYYTFCSLHKVKHIKYKDKLYGQLFDVKKSVQLLLIGVLFLLKYKHINVLVLFYGCLATLVKILLRV